MGRSKKRWVETRALVKLLGIELPMMVDLLSVEAGVRKKVNHDKILLEEGGKKAHIVLNIGIFLGRLEQQAARSGAVNSRPSAPEIIRIEIPY